MVHTSPRCAAALIQFDGLNMPVLWRFSVKSHSFHNHEISQNVKAGFHALALDETREEYKPVMWTSPVGYAGRVEQTWFPGTHGDVGGQLGGFDAARPLSNIPLVWMLERAQMAGLPLPEGWAQRVPRDATAPMLGTFRGNGRYFITRRARAVMQDPSERMHDSVTLRATASRAGGGFLGFFGRTT